MKRFNEYLYQFNRRPVYAIYGGVQNDFGFGCMDKVSIAEDLGFTSEQSGVVRNVVPHPFKSLEEVHKFPWKLTLDGRNVQEELKMVKSWIESSTISQGGGCFGPLTVTACILGIAECLRMTHKKQDVLFAILRNVTDFMIQLAKEEERLGVQTFWIAEPVASLLSPEFCRTFCIPYITEIYSAIKIPGVLHVCGNTDHHTRALLETGAQALSIDWCTDLGDCLALVPDDIVVMGNLNPVLLLDGTQEEVREQTQLLLDRSRNYKNFVMATGCQVPGNAPLENVQLMIDLARKASIWTNEEYRTIQHLVSLFLTEGEPEFLAYCSSSAIPPRLADAAREVIKERIDAANKYPQ